MLLATDVLAGSRHIVTLGDSGNVVAHPRRDLRVPEPGRVARVMVWLLFLPLQPLSVVNRIFRAPVLCFTEAVHKALKGKTNRLNAAAGRERTLRPYLEPSAARLFRNHI